MSPSEVESTRPEPICNYDTFGCLLSDVIEKKEEIQNTKPDRSVFPIY